MQRQARSSVNSQWEKIPLICTFHVVKLDMKTVIVISTVFIICGATILFGITDHPSCQTQTINRHLNDRDDNCVNNCSAPFPEYAPTILASDPRYEDLRKNSANLRWMADVSYIVLPRNADEVVKILNYAVTNNIRPTVRSGGHCYADFWSNNTGGVLIDMSSMKRIYRSPNDQTIWIESGATIGDAYKILYKEFDLTIPAGVCLDIGIGGHVLGGGYGYLARKFGLIIDYAYAFEMAHVDENRNVQLVVVRQDSSETRKKNLFWALRGGGQQNFGVITKVGFRDLPRSPPVAYQFEGNWNLGVNMSEIEFLLFLDRYVKFFIANSSTDSPYCDMFADVNIGRSSNNSFMSLRIIMLGENTKLVYEFLDIVGLSPDEVSCGKMSYYKFSRTVGLTNSGSVEDDYHTSHSAYMVGPMPLSQREALWYYMTNPNFSNIVYGSVQVRGYACAVSRVPENGTAYPHRKAKIKMQYITVWRDLAASLSHWRWSQLLYWAMYGELGPKPDDVMDGCFVNYADMDLVNAQQLYYKDNYRRLMEVKKEWDPLNIFHHRHSIGRTKH